jgi:hypothetical protein
MFSSAIRRSFLSSSFKSRLSSSTTAASSQKLSIFSKVGILLGISGLGVLGCATYDRLAALPKELEGLNFPLSARWYIRRALCPASKLNESARLLDLAMQSVLNSGLGSASPEATALVLYLTQRYLEQPTPSLPDLEAAHHALTFKPHIGEAVKEEKARLLKSFEVAHRLCELFVQQGDREKVRFYAEKSLRFLDHGPKYLSSSFENHPLREVFIKYSSEQ